MPNLVARELARELSFDRRADVLLAVHRMLARWKLHYANNTIHGRTHALRALLRHVDAKLDTAFEDEVKRPAQLQARLTLATRQEVESLLRHAPAHLAIAIRLMREAAFRWSEALRASPTGLDQERRTLTVKVKGGKLFRAHIPEKLFARLKAIGEPEDTRSYVEILRGHAISKPAMRQAWERCRKAAKVSIDLVPHDLRRSAAVELFEKTKNIFAVKRLLGHTSLQTTAWYLKAYEEKREDTND